MKAYQSEKYSVWPSAEMLGATSKWVVLIPGPRLIGSPQALSFVFRLVSQISKSQPLVEARIHETLGRAYHHHFNHKAAIPHLDRAYQIYPASKSNASIDSSH